MRTINNPREKSMKIQIRAIVVAALVVVSAFAFTSTATAGTYSVDIQPCVAPGSGMQGNSDGWNGGHFCGAYNAAFMQLNSTEGRPIGPPGSYFWVKYGRVPAGAYLQEFRLRSASDGFNFDGNPSGNPRFMLSRCIRQLGGGADGWTAHTGGGCATSPVPNPADSGSFYWTPFIGAGPGYDGITINTRNNATGGYVGITNIHAIINDTVAPTTSRSLAHQINNGVWTSGVAAIGANASDSGGGVKQTRFLIQSTLESLRTVNHSCNFNAWHPCSSTQNWTSTFDTRDLADGTYPAVYSVTDASDAVASTSAFNIRVDNTRPGTPADLKAVADGQNGWSAVNDFGATWTNTGEVDETTTQSGLDKVVVDVNPTTGGQADPAPVTVTIDGPAVNGITATKTSVSGVTVPADGQWSMRIKLVDKAGNVSLLGPGDDGSGVGCGDQPCPSETTIAVDPDAPPKAEGQFNGWANRHELENGLVKQLWNLPAPQDGQAPVCGWALHASQTQFEAGGTVINVASPTNEWTLPADLPEGINWVHIRAISCALVPADETENVEVKVDRTDPSGTYEGVETGRWYRDGQQITLRGSDALSGMTGAPTTGPEASPDARTGAYLTYTINGEGPAREDSPRGGVATLTVTGEGAKSLVFAPVDFAGNEGPPVEVAFGIDASAPEGYFESQDPQRPRRLRVPISDPVSGIENAVIQVKNIALGNWETLPTSLASFSGAVVNGKPTAAIAEAVFPDTRLASGTYQARVIAVDQAGNELVTSKNQNGVDHTVVNPMRKATGLSAAVFNALRKCKRTRGSKCIKKKKGTVYLTGGKSSVTVGYRRAGVVQGFLTQGTNYAALGRQPIEVYTKVQGQPEVLAGTVSTKADGSYYYRIKPGVSRSVRVVYPGTELLRESEAAIKFRSAAKVTLKVNKRRARSGKTIQFRGKVISVDKVFPKSGKLIALQFLAKNKWRPAVAIARTDKKGNFKVKYRFDAIPRGIRAKIKFRVYVPTETGFSHSTSSSRHKVVRVN